MPRRERWGVIGAILQELEEEHQKGADARVTNVAVRANVPYDRLMAYLEQLAEMEMVTRDRMPQLTEKGREFLRHYAQWNRVLDRFGLDRL